MSFVNPQLFFMLIVPLLLFTFFIIRHKDNITSVFSKEVLARLSVGDDSLPMVFRNVLLLVALFFMVVTLARPVIDHGERVITLEGLNAVVALDISGSMRAKDLYPNRLEFAKRKTVDLLKAMPHDELALIAFAHSSFILAPFSSDKRSLVQIVEGISSSYINMSSTNFTALGNFAKEVLEEKKPKILIVFSDGGDQKSLEGFAQIVKAEKIALYVVLVGTKEGSPVLDKDGKILRHKGTIAMTQRNDALGALAVESGGAFVVANAGSRGIKDLVATIKEKHQSKKSGEITIHDRDEYFYYPLSVGIFLLLLSFISLPTLRKKERREENE